MRNRSDPFAPPGKQRTVHLNSLLWILEPLERDAGYMRRKMFGCDAAYLDGLLYLVAADREDPWSGLMVCTSQERQEALISEFPGLRPHPVLGKWLYLPQIDENFETLAARMAALALTRDPRLGVAPRPRSRRPKARLIGA